MEENFKIKTLGELSINNKGYYGIGAPAVEYSVEKYTYLRITDINDDGTLNKSNLKSVDNPEAHNFLLKPNDIVFARTGNSTGRNYFYDGSDGELVYAGFLIKFSIDPTLINPKYIKYYMKSKDFFNWVKSFDTGGTRGNINAQTYSNLKICFPKRKQQDYLVYILSKLDDKIKLNNLINDNLEKQAQAIFKSWFVDFEPFQDGEFEDSELGMIPKGWRVGCVGDIAETTSGGTPNRSKSEYYKNGKILWVKSKELNNSILFDTEEKINETGLKRSSAKLIPSYSVLIAMYGATVGQIGLITEEATCNQAICAVLPSQKLPYSFNYLFFQNYRKMLSNLAVGSAQQNISQDLIKNTKLIIPTTKVFADFHSKVDVILKTIENNCRENIGLKNLRDTLLPKLMSGELSVEDI